MRRKTTTALLAALCLILLLPGCGLRAAKDRPAVTPLSCTAPTALSALYPAGGSRLLVTWADYEQNRTTVQLVDADADTVRQETVLDGVWDLKEQSLSDGFALCDRENVVWQFLSSRLAQTGTWTAAENVDGYFSLDGGTYYFLRDSVLFRQQVGGGQPERMPLSCDLRILDITAFDAAAGRMAVQFLLSPYGSECGTALLDVTTGQLSMLCAQRYQAALAGDTMSLLAFDNDKMGYSALTGSGDTFFFADASLFTDTAGDLYALPGAPYLVGVTTGRSTLYATGAHIAACSLPDVGIAGEMYSCCYLPETQLLVGAVYQDGAFRLYAMDPAQLTFAPVADAAPVPSPLTVDDALAQSYWSAVNGADVADSLQEVRRLADTLEDAYGVRILLSSQCREAAALCDKDITLSDSMSADAELAGISAMLDSMSRAFALYPQGFLAQFRNSVGEGGLCFLLVAHIASDYGVVGCAYDSADWQYIALDVQADYMREGTVCHEIWHATENEIRSRDYTAFDWDQWNRLNPEGFLYYGDGTMQDPAQPWTLYSSAPEDVRFVDTYSCVAATEDRARIMEFFMTRDDEAELLIQSPYIRAKLQIMCDAVRRYFDTAGWGTPRWERLL